MLSTALVPPPPTPITVIRGVKSVCVCCGMVRFRVIRVSPPSTGRLLVSDYVRRAIARGASDTFFQKIDEAAEQAGRRFRLQVDVVNGPAFAGGPGQQAGGGGKGRAGGGFRQSAQRRRPAQAAPGGSSMRAAISRTPGKLAGAAGQHDAIARGARQARARQADRCTISNVSSMPRADDVDHHAARHFRDAGALPRRPAAPAASRARRPGWIATLPYSVFSRSACATGVESTRARSLVTCTPPTGSCAVCSNCSSAKTAMLVVPPPMSITVAPSSRSSATSVDKSGGHRRRNQFLDFQIAAARCRRRGCAARWRRHR